LIDYAIRTNVIDDAIVVDDPLVSDVASSIVDNTGVVYGGQYKIPDEAVVVYGTIVIRDGKSVGDEIAVVVDGGSCVVKDGTVIDDTI